MTDSYHDQALYGLPVLDALEDGLLIVSDDRTVAWCNPALARSLNIGQEDAIGMDILSLFSRYLLPNLRDETSAQLVVQALENGADLPPFICRTRAPDGTRRWLSISGMPAHADTGNGFRAIRVRDVTGDVNAEHFMTALDQSPVVVFAQDRDLRYIWSYNQQLGLTDTSILGLADEEAFLPDDAARLTALKRRVLKTGETMRAEAALQKSEEMFRGIAQRSFDIIITSYLADGLNYASPAVERILGYCPEEMVGTDLEDYILPSSLPAWEEGRRKVLRGEQVEGLRVEVRRKDGETTILELNESPIVENEVIVGFQAVGRDISERILYERFREQAFDMTARNIAQFAVLADHVRHPLQVIMGIADLLDDKETAEKLREQVRRINLRISQLDREWIESRKIREFLKRYEL